MKSSSNAMKNTGNVVRMNSSGDSRLSSAPPRRQALTMPSSVPMEKAMTVVTPTRPRVQGRPRRMTVMTGTRAESKPNCPVRQLPRYWT